LKQKVVHCIRWTPAQTIGATARADRTPFAQIATERAAGIDREPSTAPRRNRIAVRPDENVRTWARKRLRALDEFATLGPIIVKRLTTWDLRTAHPDPRKFSGKRRSSMIEKRMAIE
jgi:hypothetical protein